MIARRSGTIGPPQTACRVTVVVPARNESNFIGRALGALSRQRDLHGQPLPSGLFDVIVFANNCSDATAAVARAQATGTGSPPVFVIEGDLVGEDAHVGAARKYVMDLAAARLLAAGKPHGLIASTDSDTVVDAQWIAWTLHEARAADAVAGQVAIAEADQARLLAPVRLLYARELAYRRAVAEIEALLDPVPEDPQPRHSSFVGASFAVKAQTYVAAGMLPPLRRLEDLHFCRALRRIDARVRHSPFVRATTSARVASRVNGGFGAFIASLHGHALRGESFPVEDPQQTIDALTLRAALRRLWEADRAGRGRADFFFHDDGLHRRWRHLLEDAPTFGVFSERVAADGTPAVYTEIRVEIATAILRQTAHRLAAARVNVRSNAGLPAADSAVSETSR